MPSTQFPDPPEAHPSPRLPVLEPNGRLIERIRNSEVVRHLRRNLEGAAVGIGLYLLFRIGELFTVQLDSVVTAGNPDAAAFFRSLLTWGGAIAGAAYWIIVTIAQLIDLARELFGRRVL